MSVNSIPKISYGLSQPLINEAPAPIITQRAPTVNDKAQPGTIWADQSSNEAFILTSIVNNEANWQPVGDASGELTVETDAGDAVSIARILEIVGGTNVNTSAAGNTVTINATSTNSFISWQTINSTVTLAAGNGYFIDMSVAGFNVTLPTTSSVGDTYILAVSASNSPTLNRSVVINQNAGQAIFLTGTSQARPTTTGVTGSLSINNGWITLVCNVANTTFVAMCGDASPTIV